jgi:hypothetical protein
MEFVVLPPGKTLDDCRRQWMEAKRRGPRKRVGLAEHILANGGRRPGNDEIEVVE